MSQSLSERKEMKSHVAYKYHIFSSKEETQKKEKRKEKKRKKDREKRKTSQIHTKYFSTTFLPRIFSQTIFEIQDTKILEPTHIANTPVLNYVMT